MDHKKIRAAPTTCKTTSNEVDYDTSISKCESDRGTHGRGTPPVREVGQPRLDELFQKLQVRIVHLSFVYFHTAYYPAHVQQGSSDWL